MVNGFEVQCRREVSRHRQLMYVSSTRLENIATLHKNSFQPTLHTLLRADHHMILL